MIFRRRRFAEVIDRQLGFFVAEDSDLLRDVDAALETYNWAETNEAEELYGDYQFAIEAATDRLAELRDAYAATVDEPDTYVAEFNRAVVANWPALSLTIGES